MRLLQIILILDAAYEARVVRPGGTGYVPVDAAVYTLRNLSEHRGGPRLRVGHVVRALQCEPDGEFCCHSPPPPASPASRAWRGR